MSFRTVNIFSDSRGTIVVDDEMCLSNRANVQTQGTGAGVTFISVIKVVRV